MPKITIYHPPEDSAIVRKAKKMAKAPGAQSLSSVAMKAIREYAAEQTKKRARKSVEAPGA